MFKIMKGNVRTMQGLLDIGFKDRGNFEQFSKGIHIGKITKAELKDVLKNYYGRQRLLEDSEFNIKNCKIQNTKSLEHIFDLTFNTLEINGIDLQNYGYNLDSDDKNTYFNDIITLIYLYIANTEKPLSVNELDASSQTQVKMCFIENSGFGNVLGIRRENDKMVRYISKENSENKQKLEIVRRVQKRKYNIPYPCKDIITALLTTMKHNPFLFMSEKDETYSDEECEKLDCQEISKRIFGEKVVSEIPMLNELGINVFKDELREALTTIAIAGGGMMEKLMQYKRDDGKNVDVDENYKFYDSFYKKLTKVTDKEYYSRSMPVCWQRINYYLFELLFAYSYYVEIFQFIKKTYVNSDKDAEYWNIIYKISQTPACYTRKKQAKRFTEDYLSNSDKKQFIHKEEFMIETFFSALYYCFLYYVKSMEIIGEDDTIKERDIKEIECHLTDTKADFPKIKQSLFKLWLNSAEAKLLWNRRKQEYFAPLDYICENALF